MMEASIGQAALERAVQARSLPRWKAMMEAFQAQPQEDCLCLISHAGYLLRIGGISFGVDLAFTDGPWRSQVMAHRLADFGGLRFVLLTHLHNDHYDPRLLRALPPQTQLIVPDFMGEEDRQALGRSVRAVRPGERLEQDGARITVLEGIHYDEGAQNGIDAVGYFLETPGLSLLFLGDVRDYRLDKLPNLPRADVAFAHVWLGRGHALNLPCQPFTDGFCEFWAQLNPRHILLTHLADDKRQPTDRWTEEHAALVQEGLAQRSPKMHQSVLYAGDCLSLGHCLG